MRGAEGNWAPGERGQEEIPVGDARYKGNRVGSAVKVTDSDLAQCSGPLETPRVTWGTTSILS